MRYQLFCFIIILIILPLESTPLRTNAETYFYSTNWEDLGELALKPLPEPFRTDDREKPIPYAGTAFNEAVYPVLKPLGTLDYESISEELLQFYDTVAADFSKKNIDAQLFNPDKPFLPHLTQFILQSIPYPEIVFYSRPVFDENGNATAQFKLSKIGLHSSLLQKQELKAGAQHSANTQQANNTAVHTTEKKHSNTPSEKLQAKNADLPRLYEKTTALICEVAAIRKKNKWYIDYIDIKEAEYAASSDTN